MLTPAGSFSNCVQIEETDALRPELGTSTKTYAPGIGLVNDDNILLLTEVRLGSVGLPGGCAFTPFSNHPLFPFSAGRQLVLAGVDRGMNIVLTSTVLAETRTIHVTNASDVINVAARVIEEHRTADGNLVSVSRDFFAQCVETGDVYHFGREVDRYQDGIIAGNEGSWLAGIGGAEAGLFMPAHFTAGAQYVRHMAPGVANDHAVNLASGLIVSVPAGSFTNCVRVAVTSLIQPGEPQRELTYAPGVGLISDDNILNLTAYTDPNIINGAPVLSIQDSILLTWPLTDRSFGLEGSSDMQNWYPVALPHAPADPRNQIIVPRDHRQRYFRLGIP
jgi:hypothetical protein